MKLLQGIVPLLSIALAGCGGTIVPPSAGFTPASPPPRSGGRGATIIGASARDLVAQFGQPRLDIRDPTAHKLQFGNGQCVMDAYLYPPRERREPVVTYAEARQTATGTAMPWQECARALKR